MSRVPPVLVTMDRAAGVATVAVHGELDSTTSSQLLERLAWVLESCPQRLVMDLIGVGDRFAAQALALIAVARHQLPPGCVLDVRSSSRAVCSMLEIAGWTKVSGSRKHQVMRTLGRAG